MRKLLEVLDTFFCFRGAGIIRGRELLEVIRYALKHLFTIFQDSANQGARGVRKYVGPVTVAVQELDGWFSYTMAVETVHSKHDITCHSKSRRNKKKKIPLCTNEEVDMDLSAME